VHPAMGVKHCDAVEETPTALRMLKEMKTTEKPAMKKARTNKLELGLRPSDCSMPTPESIEI